ncbi:MAG: low specificity L-threonine aldolase [Sphingomonadaceae bacterium]
MRFTSDNAASAHPDVLAAIIAANAPDAGYDGDRLSASLDGAFSALFDRDVTALWLTTGTAANSLALAALCPPHGGVICHEDSHIENDEAGAPEFFTHGAKLITLGGEGAKLTPDAIAARMARIAADVHRVQPRAISITNATELGRVYSCEETAAIGALARASGLGFHLDGARFANAVAHLGCHPADLTWRAGVDLMSFGFIKNGGMNAEALICFRRDLADEIRIRRKRSGHLSSKGRFQAAQILALLENDRWLDNARKANAGAQRLARVAAGRLVEQVAANELFVRVNPDEAAALRAAGFQFYDWGTGVARFVVSWDQSDQDITALEKALQAL